MKNRRVVVTGIGAITPIGNNLNEYWSSLTEGKSGAAPITLFDATNFKTKFACEVKDFVPTDFIDRKESRKLDRFCQFAVVVADHDRDPLVCGTRRTVTAHHQPHAHQPLQQRATEGEPGIGTAVDDPAVDGQEAAARHEQQHRRWEDDAD